MPGKLEILEPCLGRVTIHEGKYHQVRRMLAACGKHVIALHRQSVGRLVLPENMEPGSVRELTADEAGQVFLQDD